MFARISVVLLCVLASIFLILPAMAQQVADENAIVTQRDEAGGIYQGTMRDGQRHGRGSYTLPNGYRYEGEWVAGDIQGQGTAKFPNGSVYRGAFRKGQPHGQGQITFADGGTYDGEWREGKIDGTGIARYAQGVVYQGSFQAAQHHGHGILTRPGGYRYEGDWRRGEATGRAEITYKSGDRYQGEVRSSEPHGRGTLQLADGRIFEGQWVEGFVLSGGTIRLQDNSLRDNGPLNGEGRLLQPNGTVIEAVFRNGGPHGFGKATFTDGDVYTGTFENGALQGQGRTVYANGDVYEGQYVKNKRHGRGTFTGVDGFRYVGEWRDSDMEGQGRVTYPDGSIFVGNMLDDKAHGTGKITYTDGSSYEGEWSEGEIHGQGRAVYANGLIYEGSFKNARNDGFGIMTYPDGYRYEGEWRDGQREGQGVATYSDGTIYTGTFVAGKREGQGKIVMADGFVYEGAWAQGEIDGEGEARFKNGDVYQGMFVNGQRQGLGLMIYADGTRWYGAWQQGALSKELPLPDVADTQKASLEAQPMREPDGRHVALVIGNASYVHATRLANPLNDARAVADRFRALGYDVIHAEDVSGQDFRLSLGSFSQRAAQSEIAVVFYAGHGIEMNGRNFLIPVDARMESDVTARFETVPLDELTLAAQLAGKLGVVLVDACRDNPFARGMARQNGTRSLARGLAPVEVNRSGLLISFAAEAGATAADSVGGEHSPYTAALLRVLEDPDLEVGRMFRRLRASVREATAGKQVPIERMQLPDEDVFLHPSRDG